MRLPVWLPGLLFAGLLAPLRADQAPGLHWPSITKTFDQVDVRDVIRQLHQETGVDFVIAAGVEGLITGRFIDQPLDQVLTVIGATLGVEVLCIEQVWVLRPKQDEAEPAAERPPARGAAALLPDFVPTGATEDLGGAGLTPPATPGAPGTLEGGPELPPVGQGQIEIDPRNWRYIALLLGLDPGQPPPDWLVNRASGQPTGGDPYRNLPPRARVTPNGSILMPNGTVILPSGAVILPDGTVVQQSGGPLRYNVPFGWRPPEYRPQQGGGLGISLNGWNLGLGEGGGVLVPPPVGINGGAGTVHLPPVWFGPGGVRVGQLGGGIQYYWDPNRGQWVAPTFYLDELPPNVHMRGGQGTGRQGNLPPGWTYTLPPGSGTTFGNLGR